MINKLIAKIRQTGAPIVVGLDPMMKFIPRQIQQAAYAQCGETRGSGGSHLAIQQGDSGRHL